jgi:hypothetical protein
MPSLVETRDAFRTTVAPALVDQIGADPTAVWDGRGSSRFAYFAADDKFIVVAGSQEETHTDLALSYGLSYRQPGQHLVLVLPQDGAFPTLQRAPWLHDEARPQIWVHDGLTAQPVELPTRAGTVAQLTARLPAGTTVAQELRTASAPAHLGARDQQVDALVEWATKHPSLDAGHRRGERSWHCMGLRVLSLRSTRAGITIQAGVHADSGTGFPLTTIETGASLSSEQLSEIVRQVQSGMAERLSGKYHEPDEHWLQAVIRREPSIVGVEQPALREVPAWRPNASEKRWGRGFIDLLGVDGHGDLRIVETKLAKNTDDLLVFQGLDYFIWATAYGDVLRERIGAPRASRIVVHYVVGATPGGAVHTSVHARAHAAVLDIPHRFQVVTDWYSDSEADAVQSELLPPGSIPK